LKTEATCSDTAAYARMW